MGREIVGFMESYKYLDNLCKDMNGIGITGYIKDMEQANGEFYVVGWKRDYLQLKHYRYIRNQIVHENYASESNLCSDEDTAWLDEFYQRIMKQIDPLALYYKETRLRSKSKCTETKETPIVPSRSELRQMDKKPESYDRLLLIAVAFIILVFLLIIKI